MALAGNTGESVSRFKSINILRDLAFTEPKQFLCMKTIEFAVAQFEAKHVINRGHCNCGAKTSLMGLEALARLPVHGWVFMIETGEVLAYDTTSRQFVTI